MGYLLDHYRDQYVAILNHAVIAAADQPEALEQVIQERNLPRFLTLIEKIDDDLFKQLSENLIVFVEGPTDVKYIKMALKLYGEEELLKAIIVDTIGNRLGDTGAGDNNLKNGFEFLRGNRVLTNKVLFLFDPDVTDKRLPNGGQDFENLYVRRMADFSAEKRGVEFLLSEAMLEEGVSQGFVTKTIVEKITATSRETRYSYQVTHKTGFCDWICEERKNIRDDFVGFLEVVAMIKALATT